MRSPLARSLRAPALIGPDGVTHGSAPLPSHGRSLLHATISRSLQGSRQCRASAAFVAKRVSTGGPVPPRRY
eukprot:3261292-Pyramimonas_sp.AAC.1